MTIAPHHAAAPVEADGGTGRDHRPGPPRPPGRVPALPGASGSLPIVGMRSFLTVVAFAVLGFLVVLPFFWLTRNGFIDDVSGAWTFRNYLRIVSSASLVTPILNTLILSVTVGIGSILIGVPAAWLLSRTDMPFRIALRGLTLAAFVTPSFLGALAWILLAAPNSGWINHAWRALSGAESPLLNIYSLSGAAFVCTIYTVPFTVTIVGSALDNMAVEFEHAATTLGSSTLRTMWSVTLPLVLPAIMASFILSFIQGMTLFGVPAFLLSPGGISVVTTKLAEFYQLFPPEIYLAAAYCMPLLLVTAALLWIRKKVLGGRTFTTISGKPTAKKQIALGAMRWPALLVGAFVPVTAVILPYGVLLLVSLSASWGAGISFDNLTLKWYYWALVDTPEAKRALVNSLVYASSGAVACAGIGFCLAYLSQRRLVHMPALVHGLGMLPMTIPGIVLSVAYFSAYAVEPFRMYGTAVLLVAAFTATFLPIALAQGDAILKGLSVDLERAARSVGATQAQAFTAITAPLMRPGLIAGVLLVFIPIVRELSVAVFLVTPSTNVMTTLIYNYKDGGHYEAVCALSIILLAVTLVVVFAGQWLERRAGMHKSVEGRTA